MRRSRWTIISMALLTTFLAASSQAAERINFGVAFKWNPHYTLPALAALDKGLWKEIGLEVEYAPLDGAIILQRAVVTGAIDVAIDGLTGQTQAMAAGVPSVVVADPGITSEFYFWVRSDSPLRSPKDVKGAKIGVTRFGGDSHAYGRAVVKALGVDEKDVKFVAMGGGGAQIAGLRSGTIDITTLSNFTMLAVKLKGEARELVKADDYLPKGLAAQILLARREFLEKKPELVKRAVKGFLKGAEFVLKNPEWAIKKMVDDVKYPQEVAKAAFPLLSYDPKGRVDESKINNVVAFLIEYGIVSKEKAPPLEKIYARGFAD